MRAKRKLIAAAEPRTVAPRLEQEDWTPLHPMHVDLTGRLAALSPPVIQPYPRPLRAAIALSLAAASWGLALWSINALHYLATH